MSAITEYVIQRHALRSFGNHEDCWTGRSRRADEGQPLPELPHAGRGGDHARAPLRRHG